VYGRGGRYGVRAVDHDTVTGDLVTPAAARPGEPGIARAELRARSAVRLDCYLFLTEQASSRVYRVCEST
jgi:hypothetical protein